MNPNFFLQIKATNEYLTRLCSDDFDDNPEPKKHVLIGEDGVARKVDVVEFMQVVKNCIPPLTWHKMQTCTEPNAVAGISSVACVCAYSGAYWQLCRLYIRFDMGDTRAPQFMTLSAKKDLQSCAKEDICPAVRPLEPLELGETLSSYDGVGLKYSIAIPDGCETSLETLLFASQFLRDGNTTTSPIANSEVFLYESDRIFGTSDTSFMIAMMQKVLPYRMITNAVWCEMVTGEDDSARPYVVLRVYSSTMPCPLQLFFAFDTYFQQILELICKKECTEGSYDDALNTGIREKISDSCYNVFMADLFEFSLLTMDLALKELYDAVGDADRTEKSPRVTKKGNSKNKNKKKCTGEKAERTGKPDAMTAFLMSKGFDTPSGLERVIHGIRVIDLAFATTDVQGRFCYKTTNETELRCAIKSDAERDANATNPYDMKSMHQIFANRLHDETDGGHRTKDLLVNIGFSNLLQASAVTLKGDGTVAADVQRPFTVMEFVYMLHCYKSFARWEVGVAKDVKNAELKAYNWFHHCIYRGNADVVRRGCFAEHVARSEAMDELSHVLNRPSCMVSAKHPFLNTMLETMRSPCLFGFRSIMFNEMLVVLKLVVDAFNKNGCELASIKQSLGDNLLEQAQHASSAKSSAKSEAALARANKAVSDAQKLSAALEKAQTALETTQTTLATVRADNASLTAVVDDKQALYASVMNENAALREKITRLTAENEDYLHALTTTKTDESAKHAAVNLVQPPSAAELELRKTVCTQAQRIALLERQLQIYKEMQRQTASMTPCYAPGLYAYGELVPVPRPSSFDVYHGYHVTTMPPQVPQEPATTVGDKKKKAQKSN